MSTAGGVPGIARPLMIHTLRVGADGGRPGADRFAAALNSTLLALTERGCLAIDPLDAGGSAVRLLRWPGPEEADGYELLVLKRIRDRGGPAGSVPLAVLTSRDRGPDQQSWRRRFERALVRAAIRDGLFRRTLPDQFIFPFAFGCAGVVIAGGALAEHSANGIGAAADGGFIAFIFGILVGLVLSVGRLTPYGREVAAQARAQALARPAAEAAAPRDSVPGAVRDAVPGDSGDSADSSVSTSSFGSPLPAPPAPPVAPLSPAALLARGADPLPSGQEWSSHGGRWHPVRIGAFDSPVSGRPVALVQALIPTVLCMAPPALIYHATGYATFGLIAAAPALIFALYTGLAWLPAHNRRLGFPAVVRYEGQVVKRWASMVDEGRSRYRCAVDDGVDPVARTFQVGRRQYNRLTVGRTVVVTYSPRWQRLYSLRIVR